MDDKNNRTIETDEEIKEDGMSKEEIKKFNMYQAELRQRSIERYGRDIYSQEQFATKGLKGMQKINKGIEKILKVFLIACIIFIIIGTAYCLLLGWGKVYTDHKDYIHFGETLN